jgi:crossover junction endodeoxyribonuclease RuvC
MKKILGIDPGSSLIGYGFIEENISSLKVLTYGVFVIKEKTLSEKLTQLSKQLNLFLDKNKPDLVGLEKIFFSKNKKTAIEVSHARGVIMNQILNRSIPIIEFSPPEIKVAVTNYGLSDKQAVAKMVSKILNISVLSSDDNASDALAIAIAAANANHQNKITQKQC